MGTLAHMTGRTPSLSSPRRSGTGAVAAASVVEALALCSLGLMAAGLSAHTTGSAQALCLVVAATTPLLGQALLRSGRASPERSVVVRSAPSAYALTPCRATGRPTP